MKKRNLIYYSIIIFIFTLIIFGYSSFSRYKSYNERGVPQEKELYGGKEAWYNGNIFVNLSTIAINSDYGTFIFRKNGEFVYFPESKDILVNQISKVARYDGIWFKPNCLRLTVTKKYLNRKFLNISLKDEEFFLSLKFDWPSDMTFNDNLKINGQEFILLNNYLTKNSKEKLRLDDEIIEEFLKEK